MEFKERLEQLVKVLGLTKQEFEKQCSLSNGYINGIKNMPGKKGMNLILERYPNLNKNWLLFGEGDMFYRQTETESPPQIKKGIPLIPVDAMAGFFSGEQSAESYEYINYHVPAFRECDFLIMVKGDSMLPKYNNGDIVACKKLSLTDIFFQWGKVYIVNTSQGALIKRVEPGTTDDSITLVSLNEEYKPFEIKKEIIYDIALVCGVIKYD